MMARDECVKLLAAEVEDLQKSAGSGRGGEGGFGGFGGMAGRGGQELEKLMKRQSNLLGCAPPARARPYSPRPLSMDGRVNVAI